MTFSAASFATLADLSAAFIPPPASGFSDTDLLAAQRTLGEIRRRVDAAAAVMAAEIAHRSRAELGYDGLAQRLGARTPQQLVQTVSGGSAREAQTLVRVGSLMAPSEVPAEPWLSAVAAAVSCGQLSLEAADAIRFGLGSPARDVTAADLATAAATLLTLAPTLTLERLAARARDLRASLDLAQVAITEAEQREKRYAHVTTRRDGMVKVDALLPPEEGAVWVSAYGIITSPRRGGPRFVDPTLRQSATDIALDDRTTEQLVADTLTELLRLGGAAKPSSLLGGKRPSVQILVTDSDLRARAGMGFIEGNPTPVSIETVERIGCENGFVPLLFEGGRVLNLGRDVRLFTAAQRLAISARDGGCIFPNCERPPSWCEAHHIDEWQHQGKTDVADGVLLCRHHHMLVHNNGWQVTRTGPDYFVVPPASLDASRRPMPAPSKSPAMRRLAEAS